MKQKTLLAAAIAGAAMMGLSSLAHAVPAVVAGTGPHVGVLPPPPAPIYESVPVAREGWVWAPGHYDWRDGRYVWISGQWMRDRPGWEWEEARWVQRRDGSWILTEGRWIRRDSYALDDDMRDRRWNSGRFGPDGDLDGDGVLNRHDRDRDGDGVVNRYDDFPDDPRRS